MKFRTGLISSLVILIAFSFSMTGNVFAEKSTDIYKWVDKDGRVHYAARPGSKSAEKMHMGSNVFHKKEKKADTKIIDEETDERAQLCQDSKDTLRKYKKAPFLYRYDDATKQKVRLTKKEQQETFVQAEKDVSYWCNPPQKTAEEESPIN